MEDDREMVGYAATAQCRDCRWWRPIEPDDAKDPVEEYRVAMRVAYQHHKETGHAALAIGRTHFVPEGKGPTIKLPHPIGRNEP